FEKNTQILSGDDEQKEKARQLMTKIVNTISAKMELGAPMVCMYLLGNPDHYTNFQFRPFYWSNFVNKVRDAWGHSSEMTDIKEE
ncbi:hypothetical protein BDN72DRAFT_731007, partial [Pluteus cervinus]